MKKTDEYYQALEVCNNAKDYHNMDVMVARTYVRAYDESINYSQYCITLKDLKGNEIQIKSLSDLKKKYPKGTTFSVAGNGKELNYYVDGKIAYTRTI